MNWHSLSLEEIFKKLGTNKEGLTEEEAKERQKKFGLNKLPEEKRLSGFIIFLNQFKNPLIYILLIAAAICFFLREINDGFVILGAVFINAFIGFVQENKAEQSLKKLKKLIEHYATVFRQGEKKKVLAENLVPGDIIFIEAGDRVPADARLIKTHNLEVVEAVLTGESVPSTKKTATLSAATSLADRENMIYLGTNVTRGIGWAVVINTGLETELGKIALMVKETREDLTPLQKKMASLAKFLGMMIAFLTAGIFVLGWLTGRSFLEMFLISVAVAVAAIPESLIIGVTVCLAIGMQRILKKGALVRKLVAAETLGSTTVICSDKTGTLTEGKMKVDKIITETDEKMLLKIFLLSNDVIIEKKKGELKIFGDSTEQALVIFALEKGLEKRKLEEELSRLDEIPFDQEKMYMATLHRTNNQEQIANNIIFIKGAPERILQLSGFIEKESQRQIFSNEEKKTFLRKTEELTRDGLRVLAFGYKFTDDGKIQESDLENFIFVGLAALKDPLRQDAKETIEECVRAGIRPLIITGDHKLTTQKIAQEVGILRKEEKVFEGAELDSLNKEDFYQVVKNNSVYARVEPKHKILIIDALQESGEVVAMAGDGVNDAPAIKSADIGIALGSGTEVAKETADLVLLDDNFKTIVSAVEEGRTIFDNIKKIILYLLSSSLSEVILVVGSLFFGLPLPILPTQILWVNIIQDSLPAMALTNEKMEKEAMNAIEKGKREIVDKKMKTMIFIISVITGLILFGLFYWLYKFTNNLNYARTMTFVALGIGSLLYVFSCKNLRKTIFRYFPFNNKFLNFSVLFGWAMFFTALYIPFFQNILRVVPLKINDWLILIGFGLLNLILVEIGKLIFIIEKKKSNLGK